LALLEYQNTPWSDTIGSLVQYLMGRQTKTLVPTTGALLQSKTIDPIVVQKELTQCRQQQKYYYDQHMKPLKEIKTGLCQLSQNHHKSGTQYCNTSRKT